MRYDVKLKSGDVLHVYGDKEKEKVEAALAPFQDNIENAFYIVDVYTPKVYSARALNGDLAKEKGKEQKRKRTALIHTLLNKEGDLTQADKNQLKALLG
tara:strand:+ start:2000 stop:2296 length:297 start_codon:yes stop_codon:yes gene_type:complete